MKNSTLSQKALLVHVKISQWTGRRLDNEATETVIKAHATERAAGAYTKKLLPGATELESISLISGQIRKYFYEQTLPWMTDGARIISSKNHLIFATEFRKMKNEFESAVNDFVSAYPRLQADAQRKLGNLYHADEYPSKLEMTEKFNCEVSYLPMPDVKDFRINISESEKKDFIKKMKDVETEAMRDCWNRLHEVTKRAADKLSQPDAIFRDSLLENVKDLCDLLPALNITEDLVLDQSRREVERLVASLSPDVIRENATERGTAAKRLQEITDKMGAFMGGVK